MPAMHQCGEMTQSHETRTAMSASSSSADFLVGRGFLVRGAPLPRRAVPLAAGAGATREANDTM